MDEEPTTTPAPEPNPYLWNRRGHTPFDEMDSLDHLEWKLQEEIRQEGESLPVTGDHQHRPGLDKNADDQ